MRVKTLSARECAEKFNIPIATVTRACDRLGVVKSGRADNAAFALDERAQSEVLRFHSAELAARCLSYASEAERIAKLIALLTPLLGDPKLNDAAQDNLREVVANRATIGTDRAISSSAHNALTRRVAAVC